MPTSSSTLGGLISVLATAPPPSSGLNSLIPVLAVLAILGTGAIALMSMPRFGQNAQERRNDARAFFGPLVKQPEIVEVPDDETPTEVEAEAAPLWGTLDFSIYGEPEPSRDD